MNPKALLTWLIPLLCLGYNALPQTPEVKEVLISEYKVAFIKSDGTAWAPYWSGTSTKAIEFKGGHKFVDGDGGLYNILFRKENGDVYVHHNSKTEMDFLQYDAEGKAFKAIDVECYLRTYVAVRDDGTIWARSYNSYKWFGSDVNLVLNAWTKIPGQPSGVKFKKVTKGGGTGIGFLVAVDTDGNIWTVKDNSTTWVKKTLPQPVDDVYGGLNDFFVAMAGGKAYGWGQGKYLGLSAGTISTYQDLSAAWGLGSKKIISIAVNDNTIHYVLDDNTLWGLGDNMQGEVGLGWELVNRKEMYQGNWYVWNWVSAIQSNYDQTGFISKPQHIRPDKRFTKVFGGNYYAYYKYAQELGTGDLYSWGRNKGSVLMDGKCASNESAIPNSMDVLAPTKVDVFKVTVPSPSTFVPGTVNAGADQTVTQSTVTLKGSATPGKTSSWTYKIVGYKWRKLSGPACSITDENAATTTVTGMASGTYLFELKSTDDNTATITDTVKVVVNVSGNIAPVAKAGADVSLTLPINYTTLDATGSSDPDGSIVSYKWEKLSGPTTLFSLLDALLSKLSLTGLTLGEYKFKLTVTDNVGATGTDTVTVKVLSAPNKAPVAKAGNDIVLTLPANSTTLDGSGSADSDGSIDSYTWNKISGPASFSLGSASSAKTTVSGLAQGTYEFELVVKDNSGATGKDTVKVTVNPAPNKAPVAKAGNYIVLTLPANSATLDGSGSADSDGSIASYTWNKISGPASFSLGSASSAKTTVSGLAQGTYEFELVVKDNSGATGKDTVKVTVNPAPNKAPVAKAGNDIVLTLPANSTTLDGSGSADSDGSIASYTWNKISGPASFSLGSASSAKTTVSGLAQGTYEFELVVKDNSGATGKDTVEVTVNPAPNKVPVAKAGNDIVLTLPANSTTLDGSGSADSDGSIASYAWNKISGPASFSLGSASSAKTTVSGLAQGTYEFELVVKDNSGATGKDTVKVTVNPAPNKAPVAKAGNDIVLTLPTNSATLDGSGSTDSDGSIASYTWNKISGPASFSLGSASSAKTTVSGLAQGTYEFELVVKDNSGATGKDTVEIIVNPANNIAPVAKAGGDITITLPLNSVSLDGAGSSDADGTIVSYTWVKTSGPAAFSIVSASSAKTSVTGLVQGTYTFELVVKDNSGASSKDEVKVVVNPAPNKAPAASAGSDITITLPQTATLDGSASSDADGSIDAYEWKQLSGPALSVINTATSVKTTVSFTTAGSYVFELTVKDNNGATAKATVKVTVNPKPNSAPVAKAGNDIVLTLPTNSAVLDGSGSSDPDGSIVSFVWNKVSGPAAFSISNSTGAKATVSGLAHGVYEFELTVKDNSGATAKDVVQVTVLAAPNKAPVANAGNDLIITLPETATLNGAASSDADGELVAYAWKQVAGPAASVITNNAAAQTVVTFTAAGTYDFELTVKDNAGATHKDVVRVTVNPANNKAPVANAGKNATYAAGTVSVLLDGSASYDPDGIIASYAWVKISGPSPLTVHFANTAKPVMASPLPGTYVFELTVTDNKGAKATSFVTIVINEVPQNQLPVAVVPDTVVVQLPKRNVTLDGSASYDSDGAISKYFWKQVSGPTQLVIPVPESSVVIVNDLVGGTYVFELTVTDNKGAVAKKNLVVLVKNSAHREDQHAGKASVFPNPVDSDLNVTVQAEETGVSSITLFDLRGKRVLTKSFTKVNYAQKETINVSALKPGMYIAVIQVGTGRRIVEKVFKK